MNYSISRDRTRWATMTTALLIGSIVVPGCGSQASRTNNASSQGDGVEVAEMTEVATLSVNEMMGAKLWENNCIRCHNPRPPRSLNDRQWEIAMQHMRVRGGLTGEEARQILRFLQAAN